MLDLHQTHVKQHLCMQAHTMLTVILHVSNQLLEHSMVAPWSPEAHSRPCIDMHELSISAWLPTAVLTRLHGNRES